MDYPVSIGTDGINIKPDKMVKEKLYHCIFKNKILLVFKDSQNMLNCYEIEEQHLVNKIKDSKNGDDVEKIFEEYVHHKNLKN